MQVKIGDVFLGTEYYALYKVVDYCRSRLLDLNSKMVYQLELVSKLEDQKIIIHPVRNLDDKFWENKVYGRRWLHVPDGIIPDVHLYEGMYIKIAGNQFSTISHYIYKINEKSINLVEKGRDPIEYMQKRHYSETSMERVKRLFYSGWWKEIKE